MSARTAHRRLLLQLDNVYDDDNHNNNKFDIVYNEDEDEDEDNHESNHEDNNDMSRRNKKESMNFAGLTDEDIAKIRRKIKPMQQGDSNNYSHRQRGPQAEQGSRSR